MKLEEVYRQIPKSKCPERCGVCCTIVFPSLAEIRNIKAWLKKHDREFNDFNMEIDKNCPYLSPEKECSIYPVRPFLCRIMGTSVAIPCVLGIKLTDAKSLLNQACDSYLYAKIYHVGEEKQRMLKHREVIERMISQVKP